MNREEVVKYLNSYLDGIKKKQFFLDDNFFSFVLKAMNHDKPGHRFNMNHVKDTFSYYQAFNPLRIQTALDEFANYLILTFNIKILTKPTITTFNEKMDMVLGYE